MRLLFLLPLLLFPFAFFRAQSDTIIELASVHVIYDQSTIAITLTEAGETEYFYFVDRRLADNKQLAGYTPIDWSPQPNEKYTLQVLEDLLRKGYRLLSSTSAMGNDIVGSETSISTWQELNMNYLLSRRVPATSVVVEPDKKIKSQLKIEREDGQDWWLVVKEELVELEGVAVLERSLELEKHEEPDNFMVLSENRGAILPIFPGSRLADPFKGLSIEAGKLVLEHQLLGDTSYNLKHFFVDRAGRFFLDKVEAIIDYPGQDCAPTDTVHYWPQKRNIALKTTYRNCPNQVGEKIENHSFLLLKRKEEVDLFDFVFGNQEFSYGRRRDKKVRY